MALSTLVGRMRGPAPGLRRGWSVLGGANYGASAWRSQASGWKAPIFGRALCTVVDDPVRVAIVGTGPSGFYTAKYLLRELPNVKIDMFDRLPTPFGLVRFGVAPDHPEVKSVINDFEEVAADERVQFYGGVEVGRVLPVTALRAVYNAIVFAVGAEDSRKLGIPGEDLQNVLPARAFVNWYNGHPDFAKLSPKLDSPDAVVIGHGNVAIDCARILARSVEELKQTDIADHALEQLATSQVKRVSLVGRRGHVQAAFTIKEVRELSRLNGVKFFVDKFELDRGMTAASAAEIEGSRPKRRIAELLQSLAQADVPTKFASEAERSIWIRFFLSPVEFLPADRDPSRVGSIKLEVNALQGDAAEQKAVGTGCFVTIPAGLVLTSVGYKSVPLNGVPFDTRRSVLSNRDGVIVSEAGKQVQGLYCAGWAKRGPSGIIGTNIEDAKETVRAIVKDAQNGRLPNVPRTDAMTLLADCGVGEDQYVSWIGYQRIKAAEAAAGQALNRPAGRKIVDAEELLKVSIAN